jgi:2-keto-4-pentenoate hydratase/2-oxohepta-3-ene-1,7-dioic acid hydratase in catechol pathway
MSRGPSSGFTAVMRLARYRDYEGIHVGVIVADEIVAVRHLNLDVPEDIPAILAGGSPRLDQIAGGIDKATRRETLDDVELLAPIPRPPKFLGAGMNYATHAAELREPATPSPELTAAVAAMGHLNAAYPNSPVPVVFNKQTSCIGGPHDEIWAPFDAKSLDYEGELAIVIGRRGRRLDVDQAADVIAGYIVTNDISVREWQNYNALIWPGKSFETHGPTGPWVVTADELEVDALSVRTWVNDELRQDGSTSDWILGAAELVSAISQLCTLEPGDLIATGTPGGVAVVDGRYLVPGDRVRVEIEGVGAIDNLVIQEPLDGSAA